MVLCIRSLVFKCSPVTGHPLDASQLGAWITDYFTRVETTERSSPCAFHFEGLKSKVGKNISYTRRSTSWSFFGDEILLGSRYANFQVKSSSKNTTKEELNG